jgi:aminopeptidase
VVYASLPLCHDGNIIDKFCFKIEKGRITECHAQVGEDILQAAITVDEGASYFGEVALVPYDSPISNQKILFYNTLFDENATCHLALGRGFTNTIKDYDRYTLQECYDKGINDSMIHVDFMIGTEDLSITGITRDGKRIPVFANGTWAF